VRLLSAANAARVRLRRSGFFLGSRISYADVPAQQLASVRGGDSTITLCRNTRMGVTFMMCLRVTSSSMLAWVACGRLRPSQAVRFAADISDRSRWEYVEAASGTGNDHRGT